ncbi:protein arginine N-methyltransferase 5 [Aricia agestis]|uniref:protein arginine N-methyltransferase 5 n=1 Tax=Aricia agestis TaxID=91739 RepID=UPI001C205636|nr:protein arginine N-methyltransferase 5 [Aricia agestis]
MSQQEISCGLDYVTSPDIQQCLTEALHFNYSFIVAPIVHPRFRRSVLPNGSVVGGFTRSDMVISPQDWTTRIVGKLSPYLDVDAPSPAVRQRHEDCMNEELSYCRGLGLPAVMLNLHSKNTNNLARIMCDYFETSYHPTIIWACVPMFCNRTLINSGPENDEENEEPWNETWLWWSKFHERVGWEKRVGVVLKLSADLPSQEIIKRWLGEPVKAIIVPTSIFHNNKKGYPVLSRAHQQLVISMVEHDAQVIVSGARRSNVEHYLQYLYRLHKRRPNAVDDPMLSYARGWEDYLQTPLQPLADNLDTYTYNVFEKDPVKYDQYQKAIAKALVDLQKKAIAKALIDFHSKRKSDNTENSSEDSSIINTNVDKSVTPKQDPEDGTVTVMVLGAGRGPLVRATLNAADITNSKVKVIAVEKNPCAVVVLAAQVREVWKDRDVTVVPGDMRYLNLSPKADIIVSELLGSWGDNELSPECLDGAASLLKSTGISIPCQYKSYVAPISTPRLWSAAKAATNNPSQADKNLETLWVVYMQNKHDIAETKEVFTFDHPAKPVIDHEGNEMTNHRAMALTDNRRSATVKWEVTQDNVMHGFGGYFDCQLYGDETISIVPSTHSPGMISWFPVFIPIKTPIRVKKGDFIEATFWRCVNARRVWYEWIVEVDNRITPLHNPNGRSSEMLL